MVSHIKWLYLIALASIGCSVISILGLVANGSFMLNVIIIAIGLVSILVTYRVSAIISTLLAQNNNLNKQIKDLQERLHSSENFRNRFREALTMESNRAEALELENHRLKDEVKQLEGAYTTDDQITLENFRNTITTRFIEQLRDVNMPLSEADRQAIVDSTIRIAMMAFDIAETAGWSNVSNREEQRLNVDIVNGKITTEEAISQAIKITDNPTITPKWARALGTTFKEIVSENSNIIFSGYKI